MTLSIHKWHWLTLWLCLHGAAYAQPVIDVPLRVHLVDCLAVPKHGRELRGWVSAADVRRVVLPEVNRIWRQAGIRFVLEEIRDAVCTHPAEESLLLGQIAHAHRDRRGKSDPARIDKLNQLLDLSSEDRSRFNAWLVPYLGEKSQGRALRRERRAYVAQWTDKSLPRGAAPVRFALREDRPMRHGSLARTLAHELGHLLGLRHPDKATQREFERLMGGRRSGYALTAHEIETARRRAARAIR